MVTKYNPGDTAFIVESSRFIREVKVLKAAGGFATLRFTDSGGGIQAKGKQAVPVQGSRRGQLTKENNTTVALVVNPGWREGMINHGKTIRF